MLFSTMTFAADVYSINISETLISHISVKQARNDGSYTRTNNSVTIYTESGHSKGSYAVYLHNGKRFIKFDNTWICIQGKRRFAHNGNWYVIK